MQVDDDEIDDLRLSLRVAERDVIFVPVNDASDLRLGSSSPAAPAKGEGGGGARERARGVAREVS